MFPPPRPSAPRSKPPDARFPARHRLTHSRQFDAVYAGKVRKNRGPLMVSSLPNSLRHHRLGLAVSVRMGGAVVRNRLKRMVREAFRLEHPAWREEMVANAESTGLDLVVSVRSVKPLALDDCRTLLRALVAECATEWRRRARRGEP